MTVDQPIPAVRLSVVVVVFRMPAQARNTLLSLSNDYQAGIDPTEYEVIVVENESDRPLGRDAVAGFGDNFRYFLREGNDVSPAAAVNFGVSNASYPYVGVVVDGARMLTPGVLKHAKMAFRSARDAVVSVPGYHLGEEIQQESSKSGYDEQYEAGLLESISWPEDGYRLFEISCFSGSCSGGFFRPLPESNCVFVSRHWWEKLGGCDLRFDLPGGGYVNLDLYRRLCELPEITLFQLFGEGSFHQFHGGVTTSAKDGDQRENYLNQARAQYQALRGRTYSPPARQAVYFGSVSQSSIWALQKSVEAWAKTAAKSNPSKK